jgi:hypothetical protein
MIINIQRFSLGIKPMNFIFIWGQLCSSTSSSWCLYEFECATLYYTPLYNRILILRVDKIDWPCLHVLGKLFYVLYIIYNWETITQAKSFSQTCTLETEAQWLVSFWAIEGSKDSCLMYWPLCPRSREWAICNANYLLPH